MTPHACIVDVNVVPEFNGEVDADAIARAAQQTLSAAAAHDPKIPVLVGIGPTAVSVHVTGDGEMKELNRAYRGVDRPTDVLSFAFAESGGRILPPDTPEPLGDVIVDLDCARRQALELEHSLDMELAWLVIHGTLQLLGFGHATEGEAVQMEALETEILRALGFRKG